MVAMACAASGGATGGMMFPVVAQQLLSKIGFAWTVRIMAFVIRFNSVVVLSIAQVHLPPRRTGPLVEWNGFQGITVLSVLCGHVPQFMGSLFSILLCESFTEYRPFLSDSDRALRSAPSAKTLLKCHLRPL